MWDKCAPYLREWYFEKFEKHMHMNVVSTTTVSLSEVYTSLRTNCGVEIVIFENHDYTKPALFYFYTQ